MESVGRGLFGMFIYYGLAALVIILDQLTKWLVVKNMKLWERISIVDPYLGLLSHRNKGAAWGMLEGQMWLFYIVTVIVVAGIIYYFHKEAKGHTLFAISLDDASRWCDREFYRPVMA